MKRLLTAGATALALLAHSVLANDKPGEGITVRPIIEPVLEEYSYAKVLLRALTDVGYKVADQQEAIAQTAHLAVGTAGC
ncbi:hypothetical protein NKH80_28660 [Mesorhizobium sp. M0904]|uniref:hypothetical protein n=1 Tax=Mesorhizobium sp. M0904 TaxID=2957022 RepID=UPI00333A0545